MTKTKALTPSQVTDNNGKQPEQETYLISELKIIQAALFELSKLGSELSYQIAKNLKIVGKEIHDSDESLTAARDPFLEKDEAGKPIRFVEITGAELRKYEQGEKLGPEARLVYKFTDIEKANAITRQYNEEEHTVNFHCIKPEQFEQVAAREKIPAELIVPLLDTIIKDF